MTFKSAPATALTEGLLDSLRNDGALSSPSRFGKAPHVSVGLDLLDFAGSAAPAFAGHVPGEVVMSFASSMASSMGQAPTTPSYSPLLLRAAANNRAVAANIADPIAANQWHLGYLGDMVKIWREYDGTGVSFGVYDSGIDKRLTEWGTRYDASKEVVVGGKKYDGDYTPTSGPHGTAVAGLIAAGRNGEGTVGVSYNANITGVNIFDPYSGGNRKPGIFVNADDNQPFFDAIGQWNKFDVINNSWGPSFPVRDANSNRLVEGSYAAALTKAHVKAAAEGRGGLGTVVVNAAGNYGTVNSTSIIGMTVVDGANDSASTDRHGIAVAAYRQFDGNASSYSTRGAHLLISAPSGDFAELGSSGIWTADLKGKEGYNLLNDPSGALDYTDNFGGTSAAAPILSGVVGLMFDANTNLGWRDVKDILATSAVMPVKYDTGPTALVYNNDRTYYLNEDRFHLTGSGSASRINGGGYHFSTDYGYGAVDAFSAVRMAEVWSLFGAAKTSANEKVVSAGGAFNRILVDAKYTQDNDVTTTPWVFKIGVGKNIDIEHLDLKFTYTTVNNGFDEYDYAESFRVTVTSPDGTTYTTNLASLGYAYGENVLITDAIGYAGFRGEDSGGNWTVALEDVNPNGLINIKDIRLEFSGNDLSANNVYHYTQEFRTMLAIDGQSARGKVNDTNGGEDWLDMAAMTDRVEANLSGGGVYLGTTNGADPAPITLMNNGIDNIVTGDGSDLLTGSFRNNKMYGMRGDDTISGLGGNDWIVGGQGNDVMDGGAGRDTFFFSIAEKTGRDRIVKFTAEDRLAFDARLIDPDNDGKIDLSVFEQVGVESILRFENAVQGDRISFDTKIKSIYLVEQKDNVFFYGLSAPAKAAEVTMDVTAQPLTNIDGPHATPALWSTGFDSITMHQDNLFIA